MNINQFMHKSQHKHIHLKKKQLRNTMNAHCSMNRNNWIKDTSQDRMELNKRLKILHFKFFVRLHFKSQHKHIYPQYRTWKYYECSLFNE